MALIGTGLALLTLSVALTACGRQETVSPPTGGTSSNQTTPSDGTAKTPDSEALKGKLLFAQMGCNACHMNPATGKDYPDLRGLYGSTVKLRDGSTVQADEAYLRESILDPNKKITAGYQPSMPSYSYLKDDQVKALIAYIKSLKDEKPEFGKPAETASQ
jgi:cytochrome c oxidase subunit 2